MRRGLLTGILLAALLAVAGCDKDSDVGTRLTMTPLRYTVPAGLNPIQAHYLTLNDVPTEQARFTQETTVPWEDWTRVVPARASLIITEPGLDWGFAEEVTLRVFTDEFARPVEVFYRDQIPRDVGPRLDMIPGDLDVKPLLDGDDLSLQLEIRRLRGTTVQSLPVTLQWSFSGLRE